MEEVNTMEPLEYYKTTLHSKFEQNTQDYFDDLVKKSGVDCEENRKTVAKYRDKMEDVKNVSKKLSAFKGLRVFLILLVIAGIFAALYGFGAIPGGDNILIGIIGAVVAVGLLVLIIAVINKKVKGANELKNQYQKEADEFLAEAKKQVAPLIALFDDKMTKELVEKTYPDLKLDDCFNTDRFEILSKRYGMTDNLGNDSSVQNTQSGEAYKHPFSFVRWIAHEMGSKRYSGSLKIHWTTVERRGDDIVQVDHSQVLTAYVTKPYPEYAKITSLYYGNEAAPNLHFSRNASYAHTLNEKELDKKVKHGAKELQKLARKATKGQGTFTEMTNSEFDVLFGAIDRDNEVQFRMMFTPLAQRNTVELLKNKVGYGDDFKWTKDGMVNIITSDHAQAWDMEPSVSKYISYDCDEIRSKFVSFNSKYFKSLYFDLAPLLSVPLYMQQAPEDFVFETEHARNFTNYEYECLANSLGEYITSPESDTISIVKTQFLSKCGKTDLIHTVANGYKGYDRVDYVSVKGDDGNYHQVPVPWVEYLPVRQDSIVAMREIGLSEKGFTEGKNDILDSTGRLVEAWAYNHGIFAGVLKDASLASAFDKSFSAEEK